MENGLGNQNISNSDGCLYSGFGISIKDDESLAVCSLEKDATKCVNSFLPEHLHLKMENRRQIYGTCQRRPLIERLQAAENRRQQVYQSKLETIKRCDKRTRVLSESQEISEGENTIPDLTFRDTLPAGTSFAVSLQDHTNIDSDTSVLEHSSLVLPVKLQERLNGLHNVQKLSQLSIHEKLVNAEKRRQDFIKRRAENARRSEERCRRLAYAVQLMLSGHVNSATRAVQTRQMYHTIKQDFDYVLGRMNKEAKLLLSDESPKCELNAETGCAPCRMPDNSDVPISTSSKDQNLAFELYVNSKDNVVQRPVLSGFGTTCCLPDKLKMKLEQNHPRNKTEVTVQTNAEHLAPTVIATKRCSKRCRPPSESLSSATTIATCSKTSTNYNMKTDDLGGISFEVLVADTGEVCSKKVDDKPNIELPANLKLRLDNLTKQKVKKQSVHEKLLNAEKRRQNYNRARVENARRSEERCRRLSEAVDIILNDVHDMNNKERTLYIRQMYTTIKEDFKAVLGHMDKEANMIAPNECFLYCPFGIDTEQLQSNVNAACNSRQVCSNSAFELIVANAHDLVARPLNMTNKGISLPSQLQSKLDERRDRILKKNNQPGVDFADDTSVAKVESENVQKSIQP